MKKSKQKICKMPGCNKEVFDSKSLFCGYHKKAGKELGKKAGAAAGGVAGLGMVAVKFIANSITNKKS